MKHFVILAFFSCFFNLLNAQNLLKGVVLDANLQTPLKNVSVHIKEGMSTVKTTTNGVFIFKNISNGTYTVTLTKKGYETLKYPVNIKDNNVDLGTILLYEDFFEEQDLSTITLTDEELNTDATSVDNITGLLQASKDLYLKTVAFDWSSSFYRIRGLNAAHAKVLINGVEMNSLYNGAPQWSNWGGLNDVIRNQTLSPFLAPSNYNFGSLLGTTHINVRPTGQKPGIKISYASSNRSYLHRAMATYNSGITKNNWAFSFAASRRVGKEGFVAGTSYNAYSLFTSIEKKLNSKNTLNFTAIYAPNRRGKSAANTQEVFNLKGTKYNSYWGYQNGTIRNSRIKEVVAPIFILNHYWNITDATSLQTNIGYQIEHLGNSRLDFRGANLNPISGFPEGGGGANPNPTYWQYLPSYAIREFPANLEVAYGLQQQFLQGGQINWNQLYQTNIDKAAVGKNAVHLLYEDRVDSKQISINTLLNTAVNENINLTASVNYKKLQSQNFANVLDLLGGTGYLDVDVFADNFSESPEQVQNNLLEPNRIVGVGDRFRYNYNINSTIFGGFAQAQFKYNKVDFYTAASITSAHYQREGLYQNGRFKNTSLGKGEKINFMGIAAKLGGTYKFTGRHLLDVNAAYITQAPTIQNTFANARENHAIIPNIGEEKVASLDASYILRLPKIQGKLSGFYTTVKNANEVSFFFIDDLAFVQEILQGINKKYLGGELAVELQATSSIKLKGVAAIGQYTYNNNPNLYLASADFVDITDSNNLTRNFGIRNLGTTNLKNYKLATGAQKAFSIGFEYEDPDYWRIGGTANFLSNAYIDVSPIQRSSFFYTDPTDGLPFNDYDLETAKQLLQQERINNYMVINLVGGKSWKIKDYYISFFASINNLFGEQYKTGGFEQGRNANYRQLLADKTLDIPVFGNKYWYGRGTTYFLNLSVRF